MKRIILVGPSCAGKSFIRQKFAEKGYTYDVSYTARPPRGSEVDGVDYKFISRVNFQDMVNFDLFYEWIEFGGYKYGTGLKEWQTSDIFIMESDGIKHLKPQDRKESVIIYVNTSRITCLRRMEERGWDKVKIVERIKTDAEKFKDFLDYDFTISSE